MTEILTAAFTNTLEITLAMSVLITAVLLFSVMFGSKFRAGCRYLVWILIALRLIIPINIQYPEPLIRFDKVQTEQIQTYDNDTKMTGNFVSIVPPASSDSDISDITVNDVKKSVLNRTSDTVSPKEILAVIWITTASISFIHTLFGYFRLQFSLRRRSRPAPENVFDMLEIKRAGRKIKKVLRVYVSEVASSPMLCGFFRPTIVMPPNELDDEKLDAALTHELVHLSRRDVWIKLLLSTALALHWFNPLVHIMCRYAAQDIEFSCDEEVLDGCGDRERRIYADALLTFIKGERAHKLPLTTQFDTRRKPILRRFDRILSDKPRLSGTLLVILTAFLVIMLASCVSIGEIRDYSELPHDRYFISNGIIYATADDTPRGTVVRAYEYRRRRFVPLERESRRVTLSSDGNSAEYEYSFYESSTGAIIKASNNQIDSGDNFTYPPAVSDAPTLSGTTVDNLIMTYLSGNTLYAVRLSDGEHIAPNDVQSADGQLKLNCKPLSYSPSGTKLLYLAGGNRNPSLYVYDMEASTSVLLYEDVSIYAQPDSYNTGTFRFMSETTVLIMPYAPESDRHTGHITDLESGKVTKLSEYADLSSDRYRFIAGTPFMLHLYDGNIMLNNTRSALYLDPPIPLETSIKTAYSGVSRSGRYIWFTEIDCAHIFRVKAEGSDMGDTDHIAYRKPSDVDEVQPAGMLSDELILMCEKLTDSSWRCIYLDLSAGEAFIPSEIVKSTAASEAPPESESATVLPIPNIETAVRQTLPPFSDTELAEVTPDYVPSYAELGTGGLFAIVRSPEGDKLYGSGVPEQFAADMNEGKHSTFDLIVYSERVINDEVYYVADMWYELVYDGTRATYISYGYTNTDGEADFKLSAQGPIPFSSLEILHTTDRQGNYYREYYFSEASNRRYSKLVLRHSVPSEEVPSPEKAQPLYPDADGYPIEWYTCRRYADWINSGVDISGLGAFLDDCEADKGIAEVFGSLIKRLRTELENGESR